MVVPTMLVPASRAVLASRAAGTRAALRLAAAAPAPASAPRVAPTAACVPQAMKLFHTVSPRQSNARTGLYDFHVANGGKMVSFGGYDMPLSYGDVGQVASHHHVRNECGLFDVGHMVQHRFKGPGSLAFLESLVPTSLAPLGPYSSSLSVLLNDEGGILDDLIISKQADEAEWYVVTNAGRRTEDLAHLAAKLKAWKGEAVEHEILDGWGLVALQGPKAAQVLEKHTSADLKALTFGKSVVADVDGVQCHIARGGYTGEDGFEISIPPASTEKVTAALVATEPVQLAGLAARDSLRLEAGMCLYGHDLDESISPIEAGLAWVVSKDRRARADFPGAQRILDELKQGPPRRRVGLVIEKAPAREGAEVVSASQAEPETLGVVTSGIPSPTLGQNIAMAYVKNGHHKKGTDVMVQVRKQLRQAKVTGMPFVPSKFYRG